MTWVGHLYQSRDSRAFSSPPPTNELPDSPTAGRALDQHVGPLPVPSAERKPSPLRPSFSPPHWQSPSVQSAKPGSSCLCIQNNTSKIKHLNIKCGNFLIIKGPNGPGSKKILNIKRTNKSRLANNQPSKSEKTSLIDWVDSDVPLATACNISSANILKYNDVA